VNVEGSAARASYQAVAVVVSLMRRGTQCQAAKIAKTIRYYAREFCASSLLNLAWGEKVEFSSMSIVCIRLDSFILKPNRRRTRL
jgi:hypothetical protein